MGPAMRCGAVDHAIAGLRADVGQIVVILAFPPRGEDVCPAPARRLEAGVLHQLGAQGRVSKAQVHLERDRCNGHEDHQEEKTFAHINHPIQGRRHSGARPGRLHCNGHDRPGYSP